VEERAEEAPVFLDARGRGVEWVSRNVKQIIKEQEIDVVAYDYLQAFDNEKPQQDRRNQVTYIARTLTDITKSLDKTGVIFSQITVEKGKPMPDKHSIRESRDVSNAAEVVLLGFVPEKDIMTASREAGRPPELMVAAGSRAIFVDKCKNGPRGALISMPWDNDSACFDTVRDPETERLEKAAAAAGDFSEFDDNDWRNR
jgi:replicative DNA helicase